MIPTEHIGVHHTTIGNVFKRTPLQLARHPQQMLRNPIDRTSSDPVWVVCNTCPSGCRAYYGQGEDWKTMKPAGFMSKKFTDTQRSYTAWNEAYIMLVSCIDYALDMTCIQSVSQCFIVCGIL